MELNCRLARFLTAAVCTLMLSPVLILSIDGTTNWKTEGESIDCSDLYTTDIFVAADLHKYDGQSHLEGVAVSDEGSFAIVLSDGGIYHHIELYNKDSALLSHLTIREAGSVLASFDDSGKSVILYFVRRDILINIEFSGTYIEAAALPHLPSEIHTLTAAEPFKININDQVYTLEINGGHKIFTVTSSNGSIVYCYSSSNNHSLGSVVLWLTPVFVFTLTILIRHKNAKSG